MIAPAPLEPNETADARPAPPATLLAALVGRRFCACSQWQRRILVRWEYHPENFLGFVQLACFLPKPGAGIDRRDENPGALLATARLTIFSVLT